MHHCLKVPEILDLILHSVYEDAPSRSDNHTLLMLAVTCHAFKEIALNVLWRAQSTLVRLIKCMPDDLWKESEYQLKIKLKRRILESDFARFEFYAKRIRFLRYIPYPWYAYDVPAFDIGIFSTLIMYQRVLLPNLTHLEFNDPNHARQFPYECVGDNLISLSLKWEAPHLSAASVILYALQTTISYIQELDLGPGSIFYPASTPSLSEVICEMKNLRVLSVGDDTLDSMAIRHLAASSDLRELKLANAAHVIPSSLRGTSADTPQFSALQVLESRVPSLGPCYVLLDQLRPLQLQRIVLVISFPPSAHEVQEFFSTLAGSCSRDNIRSVRLGRKVSLWTREGPSSPIHGGMLKPMLAFRKMEEFELTLSADFNLDPADLKSMAHSWPRLKYLQLGSLLGWGTQSKISLDDLIPLIEGCPALESLGLSLDTYKPPATLVPPCSNERLTYLHVGHSIAGNPEIVSPFLMNMFPKLTGIGGAWLFFRSELAPETAQESWAQWARITDRLHQLRADRNITH